MQDRTQLPVLLVAFRRPEVTGKAIDAIREARPPRVYFAVDGPREGRSDELERVREVQDLVARFDWDCSVQTLFRDENLGCARGVSGAISWFFENEEAGIILEDDCVADPAFFGFCESMLERFRDDPGVMHISGHTNFSFDSPEASYFFSRYAQVWGWATWRNAWEKFRMNLDYLGQIDEVVDQFPTHRERTYWKGIMSRTFEDRIDSWAYRWVFAIWRSGGTSVYPTSNLVENIGFGLQSTHTRPWSSARSYPPVGAIDEVRHPKSKAIDEEVDTMIFDDAYAKIVLPIRVWRVAKSIVLSRTRRHSEPDSLDRRGN